MVYILFMTPIIKMICRSRSKRCIVSTKSLQGKFNFTINLILVINLNVIIIDSNGMVVAPRDQVALAFNHWLADNHVLILASVANATDIEHTLQQIPDHPDEDSNDGSSCVS